MTRDQTLELHFKVLGSVMTICLKLQGQRMPNSLPGTSGGLQDSLNLHMADRSSSSGFNHPDTGKPLGFWL